jgi:hypothetical protein
LNMDHTLRQECDRRNRERKGNLKLDSVWCAHCKEANKVNLNWQRPLREGDPEVVRDGRDEPIWVEICKFLTMLLPQLFWPTFHSIKLKEYLFWVCGIGAWAQGLHHKPLHQPFFV